MLTMWCGVNATMFDGLSDIESIHEQILAVRAAQPNLASVNDLDAEPLLVGTVQYPAFPPHDLRSPARQGVAIGAAIGVSSNHTNSKDEGSTRVCTKGN